MLGTRRASATLFLVAGALASLCGFATQAQVTMSVSLGFNGRFMPDHLAPLRLTLTNAGLPIAGKLEITQRVENPAQGAFTQQVFYSLSLESETTKAFALNLFVHGYVYPIVIRLRSGERVLAETTIDLREMFVTEKIALGLGDPPLPRELPEGQPLEPVTLPDLPRHWIGYDAVGRIYLGRLDTNLLTKPQQTAIRDWVLWGGELVIFGGENWRVQRSAWLEELLPLVVMGMERRTVGTESATIALGKLKKPSDRYRVFQEQEGLILVSERAYGLGKVVFYSVDPLRISGIVLPAKLAGPRDWQLGEGFPKTTGKDQLGHVFLQYPSKGVVTLILSGLLLNFALFSMAMMRGSISQRFSLWAIVLVTAGGSVGLWMYVNQSVYASTMQGLELTIERSFGDLGLAADQTWYSLFSERGTPLEIAVETELLRQVPAGGTFQQPIDLTIEQTDESLTAHFFLLGQKQQHFVFERVQPAQLQFSIDRSVRPFQVRVYNGGSAALGPSLILTEGRRFQIGEVAPGERRTFALTRAPAEAWMGVDTPGRLLGKTKIQNELFQHLIGGNEARTQYIWNRQQRTYQAMRLAQAEERTAETLWLAWSESEWVSPLRGETRITLRFFIVSEGNHVAE
jgi:hypothetical protein